VRAVAQCRGGFPNEIRQYSGKRGTRSIRPFRGTSNVGLLRLVRPPVLGDPFRAHRAETCRDQPPRNSHCGGDHTDCNDDEHKQEHAVSRQSAGWHARLGVHRRSFSQSLHPVLRSRLGAFVLVPLPPTLPKVLRPAFTRRRVRLGRHQPVCGGHRTRSNATVRANRFGVAVRHATVHASECRSRVIRCMLACRCSFGRGGACAMSRESLPPLPRGSHAATMPPAEQCDAARLGAGRHVRAVRRPQ